MGATLDKFMTIEEVPEEWRSLDVTVGGPVDASNFCDNGVRTCLLYTSPSPRDS